MLAASLPRLFCVSTGLASLFGRLAWLITDSYLQADPPPSLHWLGIETLVPPQKVTKVT